MKLLFTGFLISFLLILAPKPTYANESLSTDSAAMNYQLPYPGILPDSKLYILKTMRDRIVGFLISDPLKKAEFDLLMADKRLVTSVTLSSRGETKLSESTLSKGENYFEDALTNLKKAQEQGIVVDGVLQQALLASVKHQEMISAMEKNHPSAFLSATFSRVNGFEKQTTQLLLKK